MDQVCFVHQALFSLMESMKNHVQKINDWIKTVTYVPPNPPIGSGLSVDKAHFYSL